MKCKRIVMLKLTNKKFGKLIVIKHAHTTDKKTYWECKCDCGNVVIVKGTNLTYGYTKSCGCLRKALNYNVPYYWLYRILVKGIHEKRYHDFTNDIMTYEDFLTFTNISQCHYCGEPVIWSEHTLYKEPYTRGKVRNIDRRYNLDRKNNSIGYTKENCVVCCSLCNYIKGKTLTYDEMCFLGKSIHEIQRVRKNAGNCFPASNLDIRSSESV